MGWWRLCHVYVSLGYTTMGCWRLCHVYVSLLYNNGMLEVMPCVYQSRVIQWEGGGYIKCMLLYYTTMGG